jgi:hypothetical protein
VFNSDGQINKVAKSMNYYLTILLLMGLFPMFTAADTLPNIPTYSKQLSQQLSQAVLEKGEKYRPRTQHLDAEVLLSPKSKLTPFFRITATLASL